MIDLNLKHDVSTLLMNPFTDEVTYVFWSHDFDKQLDHFKLNKELYPKPSSFNIISLEPQETPYIVLDSNHSLLSFLSKKKGTPIEPKTQQTILHELAHRTPYQRHSNNLKQIGLYLFEHGSDTNVLLKNEMHSDVLGIMALSHVVDKATWTDVLKELTEQRKKSDNDNYATFPALEYIKRFSHHYDLFNKMKLPEIQKVAESITDYTIKYNFGLLINPKQPYNLRMDLLKTKNYKKTVNEYVSHINNHIQAEYTKTLTKQQP